MLELVCFDICAFVILVTLSFTIRGKNLLADKSGRRLADLITVTIISACLSTAVIIYNFRSHDQAIVGYILMAAHNIIKNVTFYFFASYIVAIMGTWHRTGNFYIKSIRYVPCFVVVTLVVTAPFLKLFYFYNANGMFERGPLFSLLYLCNGIYIFYAMYYVLKNVRLVGMSKSIALAVCSLFSFISSFVQYTTSYLEVSILGFTLSIIVIVLFIDNPDDKLEEVTGIMNTNEYYDELRKNFYTLKEFDIIHIRIKNYKLLEQMLNYEKYSSILRNISNQMTEINMRAHIGASLYYIREGRFRVILDGNELDRTYMFAEELFKLFNGEIEDNDMEIYLESDIYISQCPQDFNSVEEVIDFGYVGARNELGGKIGIVGEMIANDQFGTYSNIDKMIESGLVNNEFKITFKPIFDIKNQVINHAEAELKLFGEGHDPIGPDVFRVVAEQNGSLYELGALEIELVCRFMSSVDLRELGIDVICINLSAVQCLQKNMADTIIDIVEKYGIPKDKILFEITESVASDNQKVFSDTVTRLSEYGFFLALDNYGTGYSNILTLSKMPIGAVKFDGLFIQDYGNEKMEVVLEKTIEMMRALEKYIVIDGISGEDQVRKFTALGCDFLQGSYYGDFMEAERFVEFIRENKSVNV